MKPRLTALEIGDAARVLSAASGERITADMIQRDLKAGAPPNPDGSINLIEYAGWVIKQSHGGKQLQFP